MIIEKELTPDLVQQYIIGYKFADGRVNYKIYICLWRRAKSYLKKINIKFVYLK